MPQRDTTDFLAAFGLGAVVGIAAALLLKPERPTRPERVLKDLEPYRKRVRTSAQRARRGFGEGAAATAEIGAAIRDAGRELLEDFRSEMHDIIASARDELADSIDAQIGQAQEALRKSAKRLNIS